MKKVSHILIFALFLTISHYGLGQHVNQAKDAFHQSTAKIENEISTVRSSINVFPNPAVDYIIVEIQNDEEILSPVFELYSLIGTKVSIQPEVISKNQYKIPLTHTFRGYYFVVVKDEVTRLKIAHKFLKN